MKRNSVEIASGKLFLKSGRIMYPLGGREGERAAASSSRVRSVPGSSVHVPRQRSPMLPYKPPCTSPFSSSLPFFLFTLPHPPTLSYGRYSPSDKEQTSSPRDVVDSHRLLALFRHPPRRPLSLSSRVVDVRRAFRGSVRG